MRKGGRASTAELSVNRKHSQSVIPRADAPYSLTDEEAEEWWTVVNRLPAEWFPPETHSLLANYCRHQVAVRKISILMDEALAQSDLRQYGRLLRLRNAESRAVVLLATKMRITQKAEYDQNRRKKDDYVPLESPWVKKDDDEE